MLNNVLTPTFTAKESAVADKKVLFICVHNSARSQMAEAYLNKFSQEFDAHSAGLTPTRINPLVVEVMAEEGFDLAGKKTQSVFDLFRDGKLFQYVITVCDESTEDQCPIFPGVTTRLHWPFPDPASFEGSHEEKLASIREVRELIKNTIQSFIAEHGDAD